MNLATGRVCTCVKATEMPATDLVIKAVEQMAAEQKIKSLKITGCNKIPLFPANWIAGVDYDGHDPYGDDEEPEPDDEYDYEIDQPMDDDYDEDYYDPIDQNEIADLRTDLTEEPRQNQTVPDPIAPEPTDNDEAEAPDAEQPVVESETKAEEPVIEPETVDDDTNDEPEEQPPPLSQRPTRNVRPIERPNI